WGGTQRLPRVIGVESALKMILAAKRLKASEALAWGLADLLLSAEQLEKWSPAFVGKRRAVDRFRRRTWRQKLVESHRLGCSLIFRGSERIMRSRVPDDMPAPWEALQAVRVGVMHGMEAGLAYEREAIGRLALTPSCHNLVNLFFQREQAKMLPA